MSDLTNVFETESIRLFSQAVAPPAPGTPAAAPDEVWVTFSPASHPTPFGTRYLALRGVPAYHVVATADHWYLPPDVPTAIRELRRRLDEEWPGRRRILFGDSMGGFGALLHAGALQADLAITAGPQVIVDNQETVGKADSYRPQWMRLAAQGLTGDASAPDPATKVLVIYDPFVSEDSWHARHLRPRANVTFWRFPFGGHAVARSLIETGQWAPTLDAAAEFSHSGWAEIRTGLQRVRRERYLYFFRMGWHAYQRGAFARAIPLLQAAIAFPPPVPDDNLHLHVALAVSLKNVGRVAEGIEVMRSGVRIIDEERYWWTHQVWAGLYVAAGDLEGAEGVLTAVLQRFPEMAETHAELGKFRWEHRRTRTGQASARACFARPSACRPSNSTIATCWRRSRATGSIGSGAGAPLRHKAERVREPNRGGVPFRTPSFRPSDVADPLRPPLLLLLPEGADRALRKRTPVRLPDAGP